jgi:hypothetical protein
MESKTVWICEIVEYNACCIGYSTISEYKVFSTERKAYDYAETRMPELAECGEYEYSVYRTNIN